MIIKKQSNMYIWLALILIAVAALMPGQSGRETYGRQSTINRGPCSSVSDPANFKEYADLGQKCGVFLQTTDQYGIFRDEKQITLEEAKTTYSGRTCEAVCYDCSTEGSPRGKQVCFSSATQTSTGITGEPATGTVIYSNGDDWVSAQITIKNTLSDPISGIISLEITTEEELAARKGFGPTFNCESKEDVQKTFAIDAGKTETTTLTSTDLPKGAYTINVISVSRCCKYGCDAVKPFGVGDLSNQITLKLPGKIIPTYTCGDNDGKCKSSKDDGDITVTGTCPQNQGCYKEPKEGKLFTGFSFGSVGDWWNDREGWQKVSIVVGAFFVVGLLIMLKDRQQT